MSRDYQDPDPRCEECNRRLSDEDTDTYGDYRELCASCRCSNCGYWRGNCDCDEVTA